MVTVDAITPGFVAFVVAVLLAIAVVGALAMYYVATRPSSWTGLGSWLGGWVVMSSYLALLSFAVLGFALEMHLVFVNVIVGATVLTVVTRYLAYLRRDPGLESVARDMFRLMVVTELFGGVWGGTILTVFMAGLFPSMTAIFTKVYFYQ